MEYGLNRTARIEVRVSPEELDILERMANQNGVTVSDYLRWMGLWEAVKKRDAKAWKMLREKLSQEARERRLRFYEVLRLPGFSMTKVVVEARRKLFRGGRRPV